MEVKLPWREAGPPNHHDDKVDSAQDLKGVIGDPEFGTEGVLVGAQRFDAPLQPPQLLFT